MHCDNMLYIYVYIYIYIYIYIYVCMVCTYVCMYVCILSESYVFIFHKRKIAVKPTIHQNLSVSKSLFGKF